ncbi:MAG TPA: hypothetical protein VF607_10795 [Verrucomicrobiae bacterium]
MNFYLIAGAWWVLFSVWCQLSGWVLSGLGQVNAAGYAVTTGVWLAGSVCYFLRAGQFRWPGYTLLRRLRHPWPWLFFGAVILSFLGGVWYAPANYDACCYRLPRMVNWWQAGHWFWIPTITDRMNYSAVGWEWTAQPLLILFKSDRLLFLINIINFLQLPGLCFSVCRQLGVARQTAWRWMWLLPLAYGVVTQAGSIGNDLSGLVFLLLALDFGWRARNAQHPGFLYLAILAGAVLTGNKLSNLPLGLPILVVILPAIWQLGRRPLLTLVVFMVAVVASALPIIAANWHYTHSWHGDPDNRGKLQLNNPVAGMVGNTFLVAEQSLCPPVLPGAVRLNEQLTQALPTYVLNNYPCLKAGRLNEIPGEEGAGLGVAVTLPLLVVLGGALWRRKGWSGLRRVLPPVVVAGWLATLVFFCKMGSEAGPRLLVPYYLLMLAPILLLRVQESWWRSRVWRGWLAGLALSTYVILIFSVNRPLFPFNWLTHTFQPMISRHALLQRAARAYQIYATRNDLLAPVRRYLPAEVHELGFIADSNDPEYSLWRPFGQRRLYYPLPRIKDYLAAPTPGFVVIKKRFWDESQLPDLAHWVADHQGQVKEVVSIQRLVSEGPEDWYLVQFPAVGGRAGS